MNREIARELIAEEIARLRKASYADLVGRMDEAEHRTVRGSDGKEYLVEINVFWDRGDVGPLRVIVSAGATTGWSFVVPETDSLIVEPDGRVLGI